MDLGKLLFGQSYNEAIDPYREEAKAARDNAIRAQFIEGLSGEDKNALIKEADEYANQAASDYAKALRENRYNVIGNGLLGTLLNPVGQVLDATGDIFGLENNIKYLTGQELTDAEKAQMKNASENPIIGGLQNRYNEESTLLNDLGGVNTEWKGDKRLNSPLSDLGAVINLAATTAGGAGLGSGLSLSKKIALEGGLGGLQQLGYGLEQRGNLGDEESNALSDIGTGAAFGAAIPLAGGIAGKIGSNVARRGENYLANQALSSGLTNDAGIASQIARNTGKFTKARAAFSSLPKIGKAGVLGGTVAGGVALNNLLNGGSNSAQTGYNDDATYGSDLYGTTQGYNYGTYGY